MASSDSTEPSSKSAQSVAGRSDRRRGSSARYLPSRRRHWWVVLVTILGVLLVLQLVASPIAKTLLNRKLAELPGHNGKIEGLNIAFWRAGAQITDFKFFEAGHEKDPPLLHIKKASVRFAPGALFAGKFGGAAVIDGLEMNIIKRESASTPEETEQKLEETKEEIQKWQQILREAFPLTLERLEVKNGRLHFTDLTHQPQAEVRIQDLHIVATDLQNRSKANGDPMPAKVEVTGLMTGDGKLKIVLQLDPIAREPRFALNFELLDLQLPALNSFLLAYVNADVARGSFELYSEINAQDGAYDGYVKPLLRDIDFKTASDEHKNLADRLKETVVGAVTSLLENKNEEQVATKAPFAGNFATNEVDIWTTIVNLLRNAFVEAIRGGLEGQSPSR